MAGIEGSKQIIQEPDLLNQCISINKSLSQFKSSILGILKREAKVDTRNGLLQGMLRPFVQDKKNKLVAIFFFDWPYLCFQEENNSVLEFCKLAQVN